MLRRIIDNKMQFSVLQVGPEKNARNYRYRVTIKKQDGSGTGIIATTAYYLSDAENIFRCQNGAVFQHSNCGRSDWMQRNICI
jgi:hypothetical protein